jgi:uncharacterized protein (DUF983 family)
MSASQSALLRSDLLRGFRGRCPQCGRGRIFRTFLKVGDHCDVCGEDFSHHRADDFPAYLVIVIVGHIIGASLLFVEAEQLLDYAQEMVLFLPLTLILAVGLLQPVKGAVVAMQWHLGMHGFVPTRPARNR